MNNNYMKVQDLRIVPPKQGFHPQNFSSLKARFNHSLGGVASTKSGITLGSDVSALSKMSISGAKPMITNEPLKLTKNEMK